MKCQEHPSFEGRFQTLRFDAFSVPFVPEATEFGSTNTSVEFGFGTHGNRHDQNVKSR